MQRQHTLKFANYNYLIVSMIKENFAFFNLPFTNENKFETFCKDNTEFQDLHKSFDKLLSQLASKEYPTSQSEKLTVKHYEKQHDKQSYQFLYTERHSTKYWYTLAMAQIRKNEFNEQQKNLEKSRNEFKESIKREYKEGVQNVLHDTKKLTGFFTKHEELSIFFSRNLLQLVKIANDWHKSKFRDARLNLENKLFEYLFQEYSSGVAFFLKEEVMAQFDARIKQISFSSLNKKIMLQIMNECLAECLSSFKKHYEYLYSNNKPKNSSSIFENKPTCMSLLEILCPDSEKRKKMQKAVKKGKQLSSTEEPSRFCFQLILAASMQDEEFKRDFIWEQYQIFTENIKKEGLGNIFKGESLSRIAQLFYLENNIRKLVGNYSAMSVNLAINKKSSHRTNTL